MLIKHIRDDFRRPFATVVAIARDQVGLTICHSKEHYVKKDGVERATVRATSAVPTPPSIPSQHVLYQGDIMDIDEVLTKEYINMVIRSRKYFK